jgi:hypothetical protein
LSIKDEFYRSKPGKPHCNHVSKRQRCRNCCTRAGPTSIGRKVGSLCLALESEASRTGAAEAIRALVETIVLEPDGERLKITLKGDLAGMLKAARNTKRSPDTGDLLVQIKLVAGSGFEPVNFGL